MGLILDRAHKDEALLCPQVLQPLPWLSLTLTLLDNCRGATGWIPAHTGIGALKEPCSSAKPWDRHFPLDHMEAPAWIDAFGSCWQ